MIDLNEQEQNSLLRRKVLGSGLGMAAAATLSIPAAAEDVPANPLTAHTHDLTKELPQ